MAEVDSEPAFGDDGPEELIDKLPTDIGGKTCARDIAPAGSTSCGRR